MLYLYIRVCWYANIGTGSGSDSTEDEKETIFLGGQPQNEKVSFLPTHLKLQHIVNCKFGQSMIFCAILML